MQHGDGTPSATDISATDRGGNDPATQAPVGPTRRLGGRLLVLFVIAGLITMWGYVLYLAFFQGRQPPLDRIEDPAFARAAETRCAQALDEVSTLPLANESPSPEHRADVLDQANVAFGSMLDDLEGMTELVPDGDDRDRTNAWLDDWKTFLSDRESFASSLRVDPEARMLVSEKPGEGRHITGWIDEFAKANRMPSCASPSDA